MIRCRLGLRIGLHALILALGTTSVSAITDLTFFSTSDVHFGQNSAFKDSNRAAMPGWINTLPGQSYPNVLGGGPVATPQGVVIPGDLIDRVELKLWTQYIADYGVNGEGKVKFPVFDGLGNHDYKGTGSFVVDSLKKRNLVRKFPTYQSSGNLHYSWDWDDVHFVQLNLYSGTVAKDHDPFASYTFLKDDLEKNIGTSGRPIIVMQHFPWPDSSWWPETEAVKTIALLKKYNCIGIIHGHSHAKKYYKYGGIDVFDDGSTMNGDLLVFRIREGKMFVANRIGDEWGALIYEKNISMGIPASRLRLGGKTLERENFTFSVERLGRIYAGNRTVRAVNIQTIMGRMVKRITLHSQSVNWDRRDNLGHEVKRGMYIVRLETNAAPITLKMTLN